MGAGRRSQAERDDITVEIGYALLSACFLGGVVFAAVAGPTAVWTLPQAVERYVRATGAAVAGVLALIRVVHVLWRHEARRR
ncbi:hypothetical protein GLX30_04145 [Streptomyces sp. Tu 2975]|uniref:DUF6332 family protein n=1 Tax=Streptomyces sp. Tu 2975 TaxID=2676871 RepID=UPI001359214E|nr:DUF6332 family protein [Streptomyces sp. Tu 2975]QIP83390.1 hypothetical protein GLX30_04145 [Streptomyces sp. Tu 2975]